MNEKELNQNEENMNEEATTPEVQQGQAPTEQQVEEAKAAMEQMLGIDAMNIELKAQQNIQNYVSQVYPICMMDSLCKILTKAGITTKTEINIGAAESSINMIQEQQFAVMAEIEKISQGPEDPMKSFEINFRQSIVTAMVNKIAEIYANIENMKNEQAKG
jgi:hypothetical protein